MKLFAGSVSENIVGHNVDPDNLLLQRALDLAALDDLRPESEVAIGGANVSGGQGQRICLARAFYRALEHDTQYLLLDEPISALDDARSEIVVASCREFAAMGRTVVVISHQELMIRAADIVQEVTHA